jgi:hypothetical protein
MIVEIVQGNCRSQAHRSIDGYASSTVRCTIDFAVSIEDLRFFPFVQLMSLHLE